MKTKKELQQRIISHLNEAGLSMGGFATQIGVSRQVVQKWLKTDSVTFDKLFELMTQLEIDWEISVRV
jgi:predicted XRE-type DNA-binding protein